MSQQHVMIIFEAIEFSTAHEAIQHSQAAGGEAIRLHGKYLAVRKEVAERLAAAGVAFAWLCDHHGPILLVPVND